MSIFFCGFLFRFSSHIFFIIIFFIYLSDWCTCYVIYWVFECLLSIVLCVLRSGVSVSFFSCAVCVVTSSDHETHTHFWYIIMTIIIVVADFRTWYQQQQQQQQWNSASFGVRVHRYRKRLIFLMRHRFFKKELVLQFFRIVMSGMVL